MTVVAPQFQLTANASAILNIFITLDEGMWTSFSCLVLHLIHPFSPELRQEQEVFFTLQMIGGQIGLPILIIVSIVLRKPQRDLTFLNFCFTWVFYSIVFSIGLVKLHHRIPGPYLTHNTLFTDYARLYRRGPASLTYGSPLPYIHSNQECMAQAVLTIGAQVMTDTAMCVLIMQVAVHHLPLRYWSENTLFMQLWLDFRAIIHGPRGSRQIQWTRAAVRRASWSKAMALM